MPETRPCWSATGDRPSLVRVSRRATVAAAAVALLLVAGGGVLALGSEEPEPRRGFVAGLVTLTHAEDYELDDTSDPARLGPARLRLAGRRYVVPAGTPSYGVCSVMLQGFDGQEPCLVQLRADPDGRVRSLDVIYAKIVQGSPYRNGFVQYDGTYAASGSLRSVTATEITMDSGLVLTRHPAMSDSCPRSFADWDGAVEIQVTTDARAVHVGCLLKD